MSRRVLNLTRMLRAERQPRSLLERTQVAALRALVRHAFEHVPAYRDLWTAHGVTPDDVRSLADLARLPIVDKAVINDIGPERFIDKRLVGNGGLVTLRTSGSSGKPFVFYADARYNRWRKAQRLRPYVTNGVRPWHRVLIVGLLKETPPTLANRIGVLRERRASASHPGRELARIARESRPDVLVGYPSALGVLADEWPRQVGARPPRLVFTDSEMLLPAAREHIRAAFGADPIDVYGSYETDNIAIQCAARDGLHVAMESVILEIVADGRPVPAGEEGEVVVTLLHNRAMPFIRYNLRDVSAYSQRDACGCGRTLPQLIGMRGRRSDCLILANGEPCSALPLMVEFNYLAAWIREYRIVQRNRSEFEVLVRLVEGATAQPIARRLDEIFARHVPGARVTLTEYTGELPRDPNGKHRCFVSAVRE